ncbi:MAG: hypothetical protein ACHQX1_03180, partial [Candidatus Micrarchaeales archaeon]
MQLVLMHSALEKCGLESADVQDRVVSIYNDMVKMPELSLKQLKGHITSRVAIVFAAIYLASRELDEKTLGVTLTYRHIIYVANCYPFEIKARQIRYVLDVLKRATLHDKLRTEANPTALMMT